jgi:hypothetical protein
MASPPRIHPPPLSLFRCTSAVRRLNNFIGHLQTGVGYYTINMYQDTGYIWLVVCVCVCVCVCVTHLVAAVTSND